MNKPSHAIQVSYYNRIFMDQLVTFDKLNKFLEKSIPCGYNIWTVRVEEGWICLVHRRYLSLGAGSKVKDMGCILPKVKSKVTRGRISGSFTVDVEHTSGWLRVGVWVRKCGQMCY